MVSSLEQSSSNARAELQRNAVLQLFRWKSARRRALRTLGDIAPFLVLAVCWELASLFSKPFLIPGLDLIAVELWKILTTPEFLFAAAVTWLRLAGAVLASVLIGVPIGIAMGFHPDLDRFIRPIIKFIMGVPALNWVIIVIIWFANTELRIAFVLIMLCTPVTIFCVYDGVRSIDRKLTDMVQGFGASGYQRIRYLIWPYVKAYVFTATKLNVGNAIRTVIVAELVGAPYGIGKELDEAKNIFNMPAVLAWTLLMVVLALLMARALEHLENRSLRWRDDNDEVH
ncbi:MAG: ABC transporter permease [Pseudolabrys sp.]|nr:ABC transporter permease [Pseudolabrys sp.]